MINILLIHVVADRRRERHLADYLEETVNSNSIQLHRPLIAACIGIVSVELALPLLVFILKLHKMDQTFRII